MSITDRTRKLLWARSGNRCAYCKRELTVETQEGDPDAIIGDECHIAARHAGGARFDRQLSVVEIDDYSNLILLCRNDHGMVDAQPLTYTVPKLLEMKATHEAWVRNALLGKPETTETPLIINIRLDGMRHTYCFDPDFVRYIQALLAGGGKPKIVTDIEIDFLQNVFPVPVALFNMTLGTLTMHGMCDRIRASGASTACEREFLIAFTKIETQLNNLESDIKTGLLLLLTNSEIARWVCSDEDMTLAVHGYLNEFLWPKRKPWQIDVWMNCPPRWKVRAYLSEPDSISFVERTHGARSGTWLDFSHEELMSSIMPAVVFRATRLRSSLDQGPIPDTVFDLQRWFWERHC